MSVSASSYRSLPLKPGVYLFLNQDNEVLYVGKAKNLKKRVSSYFNNLNHHGPKTKLLVSKIKKIETITVASEIEALLLEANCIKKYKPKYNTRLTDGKAYPLIRITVKDKYPKILIARRLDDKKCLYFGPFPNAGALRLVLKTIRKIFPFQSVVNHPKRPCLYYHLGLCPCPEIFDNKDYKKNINHIISFLKGDAKKVVKELKDERDLLSKKEEFEKASLVQKKVDAIFFVTSPAYERFDYKLSLDLEEDLRNKELSALRLCLTLHGVKTTTLKRIECYDISNISGQHATGSMVVFINGEKDLSQYRRFKIKNLHNLPNLPNDFAMMQQIISRRLNHQEWPMANLVIVDGGKGQVSAAMNAIRAMKQLNSKTINIPIIGIAKRDETIISPLNRHSGKRSASRISKLSKGFWTSQNDEEGNFTEISLPKDSPALHLIMRIRDEAHRFAINYHRKLRSNILYK